MTKEKPDIFRALTKEEKELFLESYMGHLRQRDGEMDMRSRRFSIREEFFQDIEANPIRRYGPPVVDQVVFERNEKKHQIEPGLDEETLWALATAKSNILERDGIEYFLSNFDPAAGDQNDPFNYIAVEEFYHTRTLKDALEVLGLEMHDFSPHPVALIMNRIMVNFPKPITNPFILCAELVGAAAFRLLRDKADELFDDQPESLKRIDDLFQQILVDEVGHVHYVRSQLGPVRLAMAQKMLPAFSRYLLSGMSEYQQLFGDKLLDTILKADVDGAVADYPDKFVPTYR